MRAEKAIAEPEGHAAGMLWDIAKFYEHFIHAELVRKGVKLGFGIRILRAALVHYRAPQVCCVGGFVCGGLLPPGASVLGATWPPLGSKCTLSRSVTWWWPGFLLQLSIFISTIGRLQRQDRRIMWLGRSPKLLRSLTARLNGAWAVLWLLKKAAVVASFPRLATGISRSLKELWGMGPGLLRTWASITYSSGRHRSFRAKATTRAKRFQGLKRRAKRLKALVGASGNKASKVFVAGFKPSVGFGMEVWGCEPRNCLPCRGERSPAGLLTLRDPHCT